MKMQIITTSCSRRELELEQIRNYFIGNGFLVTEEDFITDNSADVILVSTCGFTQAAEDFAIKTLERIENEKKPGCRVIVGGCLPKINPSVISKYEMFDPRSYEKLDNYMGFDRKFTEFPRPNIIKNWKINNTYREHGIMNSDNDKIDEIGKKTKEENLKIVKEINEEIMENHQVFRIQCLQGCINNCSYCAIKFAIGKIKSRPIADIIKELKIGIEKGHQKICLEGDSLGGYGLDLKTNLGVLLDGIIEVIKDKNIQISIPDVSPSCLKLCNEQVIKLAQMKKLFNFYIPVQSGSQRILNLMKRGYNIENTRELILKIKQECPELKLGTSIIVGFPSETREDLEETIQLCKDIRFDYIWCHSFSARRGTEAAELPGQIPGEEILQRSRYFKEALREYTKNITIAEDTKGNRTCQG